MNPRLIFEIDWSHKTFDVKNRLSIFEFLSNKLEFTFNWKLPFEFHSSLWTQLRLHCRRSRRYTVAKTRRRCLIKIILFYINLFLALVVSYMYDAYSFLSKLILKRFYRWWYFDEKIREKNARSLWRCVSKYSAAVMLCI